jgi:hypothetical protein
MLFTGKGILPRSKEFIAKLQHLEKSLKKIKLAFFTLEGQSRKSLHLKIQNGKRGLRSSAKAIPSGRDFL